MDDLERSKREKQKVWEIYPADHVSVGLLRQAKTNQKREQWKTGIETIFIDDLSYA